MDLKITLGLVVCLLVAVNALPADVPPVTRNTIFLDERLEGNVFEDIDEFENFTPLNDADNPYRIPRTTKPNHYDVLWQINVAQFTMSGTVDIYLQATQDNVNEVVVHCGNDLNLSQYSLSLGTTNIPVTLVRDTTYQFCRFGLTTGVLEYFPLTPVVYVLSITFDADLRTDMYGIYRSWYRNNHTEVDNVSLMATTQFQATAGRDAFPCYDEPYIKATFDVTIRRPSAFTSWFCTRLISSTASTVVNGYFDDVYYTTPIMSVYLLALIVAEYESLPAVQDPVTYEVIGRPGAIRDGQGQYAYDVGQELLAVMSEHTGIDFYSQNPQLKMTQAAIPDFSAGAMENWGLLTYREAYLMYDEEHTTSWLKQLIAYILSHEIAHMWYGNMVTCDWWDVTWLNEGFARYYQYFLTHWVETEMGFETRFIVEQIHVSLLADSVDSAHPLTNPGLSSNREVSGMFTTITYNKGAAIIRMTEFLLGFDVNERALNTYLTRNAFDSVLPIDLFSTLEEVGTEAGVLDYEGFSFVDYYRSWTEQAGHPVLNVNVNHQTGEMTIIQRRFNINSGYSSLDTNYIIPITFATASNPDFDNAKPTHIISNSLTIINRSTIGDEWVIFNKQQTGFYRVNYDEYTWNLIVIALRSNSRTQIHEYNRAQIVNDVFSFARSGLMTYTRAFNILSFLEYETEYAPWVAAMTGFTWLRNRLVGTTLLTSLETKIAEWASNLMNQLTYYPTTGESFMRSYLRYQIAPIMCNMGVQACLTAADSQFRGLIDSGSEVPVDSRNWVYCTGLRRGSESDFTAMWNRYNLHNVYSEKILLLQVLGCSPYTSSITTFLNAIVTDNLVIRPQDYTTAFNSAVTGNEVNTQIVFTYIQNNINTVREAFGSLRTPLSYVASRLRSQAEINTYVTWCNNNQAVLADEYEGIVSDADSTLQSINWASSVSNDISSYLVTGDEDFELSTPANLPIVEPEVEERPDLTEPETPTLDDNDSAVTSTLSIALIVFTVCFNFIL